MRISVWSSDVCSSDLQGITVIDALRGAVSGFERSVSMASNHTRDDAVHCMSTIREILGCMVASGADSSLLLRGANIQFAHVVEEIAACLDRARAALHSTGGATGSFTAGDWELLEHELAECDECYVARSEEHTSELQSLMRISYAVF